MPSLDSMIKFLDEERESIHSQICLEETNKCLSLPRNISELGLAHWCTLCTLDSSMLMVCTVCTAGIHAPQNQVPRAIMLAGKAHSQDYGATSQD